MGVQKAMTL